MLRRRGSRSRSLSSSTPKKPYKSAFGKAVTMLSVIMAFSLFGCASLLIGLDGVLRSLPKVVVHQKCNSIVKKTQTGDSSSWMEFHSRRAALRIAVICLITIKLMVCAPNAAVTEPCHFGAVTRHVFLIQSVPSKRILIRSHAARPM